MQYACSVCLSLLYSYITLLYNTPTSTITSPPSFIQIFFSFLYTYIYISSLDILNILYYTDTAARPSEHYRSRWFFRVRVFILNIFFLNKEKYVPLPFFSIFLISLWFHILLFISSFFNPFVLRRAVQYVLYVVQIKTLF